MHLVKASSEIAEQFHFSREILFLISPSSYFLSRSLDFVDKLMSDYQNRLDKLCVIIISRDTQLQSKINNIILQDKESRIIIPFSYDELLDGKCDSKTLQTTRLKSSFYERDLFAYETPLKTDTYFFGRQSIIQGLYGKYQTGQCGSLFGLRRIGKTSVLYAVLRLMSMRNEPGIYIDCSETSFHMRRWNQALHFISKEINKTLSTPLDLHNEDDYTELNASMMFEEDLSKIYSTCGNKRILILLDEIENITFDISPSVHWRENLDFIYFWQAIRSLFQKRPELMSFIISGVNPKAIETAIIKSYDNPIYRFITPLYLPFFTQEEVKSMVNTIGYYMGMSFDDEVYTYLTDDFGGHPFLIRQVCSRLFKDKKTTKQVHISKFNYESKREILNKSITDYLSLIITVLKEKYTDEFELLEYLAKEDYDTFNEFYQLSSTLIEHLTGYGLIAPSDISFTFTIKSLKPYLIESLRIKSKPTSFTDKIVRVTTLRNTLEMELRKLIKQNLKYKLGVEEAKSKFIEIISPPSRQKQLQSLNYNDIFNSKLYYEDLRKVIEKNWELFKTIFNNEKTKFNQYMEFINSHRVDAHANEIDDDNLAVLEIAVAWLNNRVSDYTD